MADSRNIFSLWIGPTLGAWEQLCINSFLDSGYSFTLYTYGQVDGVPHGAGVKDAREVEPESSIFRPESHGKTFSGFSNLFRYSALNKLQGVWVDLDVLCLRPLPVSDYLLGFETLGRVNGAVLSYPPGSPFGIFLESACRERSQSDYRWGDLGPNLITEAVGRFDLWSRVHPVETFYPVHFRETWRLLEPKLGFPKRGRIQKASTLHLWKNVISRFGGPEPVPPSVADLLSRANGALRELTPGGAPENILARRMKKSLRKPSALLLFFAALYVGSLFKNYRIHRFFWKLRQMLLNRGTIFRRD